MDGATKASWLHELTVSRNKSADTPAWLDDRAGSKATIIASQLPVEHWHAWIGDATIADAILDRIMQRTHRLTLTGDSLRAERPKTARKEKNIDPS
jgi:DNA replication protein DnaC